MCAHRAREIVFHWRLNVVIKKNIYILCVDHTVCARLLLPSACTHTYIHTLFGSIILEWWPPARPMNGQPPRPAALFVWLLRARKGHIHRFEPHTRFWRARPTLMGVLDQPIIDVRSNKFAHFRFVYAYA
jgi:hypothetical protein